MARRFIPGGPILEPRAGERAVYCGFLDEPPAPLVDEPAVTSGIRGVRAELCSLGGGACIVREVEELVV